MTDFVICIDPSVSSTGVSIYNTQTKKTHLYSYSNKITKVKKNLTFETENYIINIERQLKAGIFDNYFMRYSHIADSIYDYITSIVGDKTYVVYIEGYSYASVGKTFHIGEYGALLKKNFYDNGIEMNEIPPAEWKKHSVGKGNASKKLIYDTAISIAPNVFGELYARGFKNNNNFIQDMCDVLLIEKYVKDKLV